MSPVVQSGRHTSMPIRPIANPTIRPVAKGRVHNTSSARKQMSNAWYSSQRKWQRAKARSIYKPIEEVYGETEK